jgi:hypothetical protein
VFDRYISRVRQQAAVEKNLATLVDDFDEVSVDGDDETDFY